MRKNKLCQILVMDYDKREYALSKPILIHSVTEWTNAIIEQQKTGRDISYSEFKAGGEEEHIRTAEQEGLVLSELDAILPDTYARSTEYVGKLPEYAASADRSKLVKILCKGTCRCERFAELNLKYPGIEQLCKAKMFKYTATCLICGYEASDNYNWSR